MNDKKIFIDCDPGVDDLVAILAALKMPGLEVVGLASVAGNLPVDITTANVGKILRLAGREDLPFAKGAALPLVRDAVTAEQVHGASGLGSLVLPESRLQPVEQDGARFLYECAKEYSGGLVLVAIGPLTNVARCFTAYPDVRGHLKEIVVMGGGFAHGNVTQKAEFNIFADPHAAHVVFESGVPVTMVGLDATMAAGLSREESELVPAGSAVGKAVRTVLGDIFRYSESYGLGEVACVHDMTAVLCTAQPELFDLLECRVDIELKGKLTFGQTVCDVNAVGGRPVNAKVAMGVKEGYRAALHEVLARF